MGPYESSASFTSSELAELAEAAQDLEGQQEQEPPAAVVEALLHHLQQQAAAAAASGQRGAGPAGGRRAAALRSAPLQPIDEAAAVGGGSGSGRSGGAGGGPVGGGGGPVGSNAASISLQQGPAASECLQRWLADVDAELDQRDPGASPPVAGAGCGVGGAMAAWGCWGPGSGGPGSESAVAEADALLQVRGLTRGRGGACLHRPGACAWLHSWRSLVGCQRS